MIISVLFFYSTSVIASPASNIETTLLVASVSNLKESSVSKALIAFSNRPMTMILQLLFIAIYA